MSKIWLYVLLVAATVGACLGLTLAVNAYLEGNYEDLAFYAAAAIASAMAWAVTLGDLLMMRGNGGADGPQD